MSYPGYDALGGADESALNAISTEIYKATYPNVFAGSIPVGQLGIKSVDYDIQAAPAFKLRASDDVAAVRREFLATAFSANELDELLADSIATFSMSFPKFSVSVVLQSGPPKSKSGSLLAGCEAQINSKGYLVLTILTAKITIPDDQDLADLLNKAFVPRLIDFLNLQLLGGIAIPPLKFHGVRLQGPVPTTLGGELLTYTALTSSPPVTPPTGGARWPAKQAFLGGDTTALNAIADSFLDDVHSHGSASASIDLHVCTLKAEASYDAGLANAQFELHPGSGDAVTASMDASVGGSVSLKCGVLHASAGIRGTATPKATAQVTVSGGEVFITFVKVNAFKLSLSIEHLPKWADKALSSLISAFTAPIVELIGAMIRGLRFPVYAIPTIPIAVGGMTYYIKIHTVDIAQIEGPNKTPLVVGSGIPSITTQTLTLGAEPRVSAGAVTHMVV